MHAKLPPGDPSQCAESGAGVMSRAGAPHGLFPAAMGTKPESDGRAWPARTLARHLGMGRARPCPQPADTLGHVPGRLAQLGERRLDKAEVTGSSPVSPMTETRWKRRVFSCSQRRRREGSDRAASSWRPPTVRGIPAYARLLPTATTHKATYHDAGENG